MMVLTSLFILFMHIWFHKLMNMSNGLVFLYIFGGNRVEGLQYKMKNKLMKMNLCGS